MSERMMIMRYFDSNTGILISDSSRPLLSGKADDESLRKTLSHCILSASGWRAVMAASGDEEDSTEETSEEMLLIAAAAAAAFFDYLGMERPRIVMGCDSFGSCKKGFHSKGRHPDRYPHLISPGDHGILTFL